MAGREGQASEGSGGGGQVRSRVGHGGGAAAQARQGEGGAQWAGRGGAGRGEGASVVVGAAAEVRRGRRRVGGWLAGWLLVGCGWVGWHRRARGWFLAGGGRDGGPGWARLGSTRLDRLGWAAPQPACLAAAAAPTRTCAVLKPSPGVPPRRNTAASPGRQVRRRCDARRGPGAVLGCVAWHVRLLVCKSSRRNDAPRPELLCQMYVPEQAHVVCMPHAASQRARTCMEAARSCAKLRTASCASRVLR